MKRKRKILRSQKQINEGAISYNLPFLNIIRKKGFFWIHEKTINSFDPFDTGIFKIMLDSHNLTITEIDKNLKIFKIQNNVYSQN